MNRIAVIGTGYVGLVTGACLSDYGLTVTCADKDTEKIHHLQNSSPSIFEPGLEDIVARNVRDRRLQFTTDVRQAVEDNEVIFIAVGTPSNEKGGADLRFVEEAVREIASYMNSYKVIVCKSTVPVGTGRRVSEWIGEELRKRGVNIKFDVVSNPEFLREGSAVYDFTNPDRIVIGTESARATNIMKKVYSTLHLNETPFVITNMETAEMIKYASNAYLAMRITYMNEIANLCEQLGADVLDVAHGMGLDDRIGPKYLHPGPGYGGSCLPKDTLALAETGRLHGAPVTLVEQTIKANAHQITLMIDKIETALGGVAGKQIAVLGLAFKPNTSDMREAPSLPILLALADKGAMLRVYDPVAIDEAERHVAAVRDRVIFCRDEYETMAGSDALILMTEWNRFRSLDLDRVKGLLKEPRLIDLRNMYRRKAVEACGFVYMGVGQGQ